MQLEASLLDEELADATLAGALHEHRELLARRELRGRREQLARRELPGREPETRRGRRTRPGDRDRAGELGGRAGWAWSRLFRRYDEFAAALVHLRAAADSDQPSERRADRADSANV